MFGDFVKRGSGRGKIPVTVFTTDGSHSMQRTSAGLRRRMGMGPTDGVKRKRKKKKKKN